MRNRSEPGPDAEARGTRIVVLACAASAGAHAGLVPAHLTSEPQLGSAFLVAVALLLGSAIAVVERPRDRRTVAGVALLLAGLVLGYLASRTTGIPVLAPEPEAVDPVGVVTIAVELVGLICALWLLQPRGRKVRPAQVQEVTR